jgi:dienelactone hydrolase
MAALVQGGEAQPERFTFPSEPGPKVGTLWRCRTDSRAPLVLVCHGGSSHRLGADVVAIATAVTAAGFAHVASIDGPVHGDNSPWPLDRTKVLADFRRTWVESDGRIGDAVRDWMSAVTVLLARGDVDFERIGWFGLSMGTAYGVPMAADSGLFSAMVLGMWSLRYPGSAPIAAAAPRLTCPVVFQARDEDALFTRQDQQDLFDRLGSEVKSYASYPGPHALPGDHDQIRDAVDFLSHHLSTQRVEATG